MDIVIGSGDDRQVITFSSGYAMRQMEKTDPIGYVKAKGLVMHRVRNGESKR